MKIQWYEDLRLRTTLTTTEVSVKYRYSLGNTLCEPKCQWQYQQKQNEIIGSTYMLPKAFNKEFTSGT